jgi:hypothetical protein
MSSSLIPRIALIQLRLDRCNGESLTSLFQFVVSPLRSDFYLCVQVDLQIGMRKDHRPHVSPFADEISVDRNSALDFDKGHSNGGMRTHGACHRADL